MTTIKLIVFISIFIGVLKYKTKINEEMEEDEIEFREGATIIVKILASLFLIVVIIGSFLSICANMEKIALEDKIDKEIQMYEEENIEIEEKVKFSIKEYVDHEENIFNNFSNQNLINIVAKYPEIKSDKLVMNQIRIFEENNREIKNLKKEKLNIYDSKVKVNPIYVIKSLI